MGAIIHGHTSHGKQSREWSAWREMRRRCVDSRRIDYHRYGGRGISFCERWKLFDNFLTDMGPCPIGCTLERIDNNEDYGPDNCKWATRKEQANNRRPRKPITLNGETHSIQEWAIKLNIKKSTLASRLNRDGWTIERALSVPVRKRTD